MGAIPSILRSRLVSLRGKYVLPGSPGDQHWIPQSGGADSAALAITLLALFPDTHFKMIFTDTGVDEAGCYKVLDQVEAWTGQPIVRIKAERNLFELIDHYNGFLPSHQSRYCTRELKTVPFERFMREARAGDETIHAYVGLRADEQTRLAFTSPVIETHLPFVELGLLRADIMQILSETIGVPAYYRRRTRSGCANCFFQRRTELVGLMLDAPEDFDHGMALEKVPQAVLERHTQAPSIGQDVGWSANHLTFPIPKDLAASATEVVELKGRKPRYDTMQLFSESGQSVVLFAAYELFHHPHCGVWWQRFLTFSTQLHSIKKQLDNHWVHRRLTAEAHHLDQAQMDEELKLVIACIELPAELVDVARVSGSEGSVYTWSEGESYSQIRHLASWAMRSLHAAGLQQEVEGLKATGAASTTWESEQLELSQHALEQIREPIGQVLMVGRYAPRVKDESELEIEEKRIACPMCTLGL